MKTLISVIIPTYNNHQFPANLKNNLPFLKGCEIIVVNDNPDTSITDRLSEFDVHIIQHEKNKGFAGAVNTGIHASKSEYIFLLNDDVLLQDASFRKTLDAFNSDSNLFAVSFAQIEKNGQMVGKNVLFFRNGFMQHDRADNLRKGPTGWAEGGSAIFDATKMKQLGGMDELYSPFYWEDIDLSYRAKLCGYEVIFDPGIKVIHHHETTIGSQFSKKKITAISYRNQLICIWKNISSLSYIIQHKYHLLKLLVQSMMKGDGTFLKGFFQALLLLPQVFIKRFSISHIHSDHEILEKHTQ